MGKKSSKSSGPSKKFSVMSRGKNMVIINNDFFSQIILTLKSTNCVCYAPVSMNSQVAQAHPWDFVWVNCVCQNPHPTMNYNYQNHIIFLPFIACQNYVRKQCCCQSPVMLDKEMSESCGYHWSTWYDIEKEILDLHNISF